MQPTTPVAPRASPGPHRWTLAQFYRLGELDFFQGQKVMLIDGEIWTMSPLGFTVRGQLPLELGQSTDPEPDLAVVSGDTRTYRQQHPKTAVLVVEISDTSLSFDQYEKASLYAAAGIADYWIVNLVDGRLEVRRDPRPDPAQPFGHAYAGLTYHPPGASVAPLAIPGVRVAVSDLLP
jgi:Uma2 family endonuclease